MNQRRTFGLLCTAVWISATGSLAADVFWTSAVNGNWSDGTKWSTGSPPDPNDNVFIDVAGTYTVTLDGDVQIAGLTLGGASGTQTLAFGGFDLAAAAGLSIEASGRLNFNATGSQVTGVIACYGTMTSTSFSATTTFIDPFTLHGHMPLGAGGNTTIEFLGGLIVADDGHGARGLLEMTGNNIILRAPTIVNHGDITDPPSFSGIRRLEAAVHNGPTGVLEAMRGGSCGCLELDLPGANHVNEGTINVVEERFTVTNTPSAGNPQPSFTMQGGLLNLAAPQSTRAFIVNGGTLRYAGGEISGVGRIQLGAGTVFEAAPLYENSVRFELGANTTLDGDITNLARLVHTGNSGTVAFNGRFINGPGGFLEAQTGNSTTTFQFNDPNGLLNQSGGTLSLESNGNGGTVISVPNGPLVNQGLITGVGLRSKTIEAEVYNFGQIETVSTALTIQKPDAQHQLGGTLNLGGGNLVVNQSGASPSCALSGDVNLLGRSFQVNGGSLEVAGGQFVGGGRIDLDGVTVDAGQPSHRLDVQAGVTLDLGTPACTINVPVRIFGTLTSTLNSGLQVFNAPLEIGRGGWHDVATGNGGGGVACNGGVPGDPNAPGYRIGGRTTMDTNGNGNTELHVNGGPLVIDPNGILDGGFRAKTIYATSFVNHGLIENRGSGPIRIEQLTAPVDVPSRNFGLIQQSDPQPDQTVNIVMHGSSAFINEASGVMFLRGSVTGSFTNYGLCRGRRGLNFFVDTGDSLLNAPGATMEAYSGDLVVQNIGGTVRNDGLWLAETAFSPTILVAGDWDNYDPAAQRVTGGHLRVRSPGEFCVLAQITEMRSFIFHCINELDQMCTSGQHDPGPFVSVADIDPNSTLIIEDMPFTVAGSLNVDGTASILDGAVLTVPGQLDTSGTLTVKDSTVNADSVTIGGGEFTGDNSSVQSNIVNASGRVRPGQSPGRFDAMLDYIQEPNAALEIELAGVTPETEHDLLAVGQTAALGGMLEVVLLDGFVPDPNQSFTFLTAAGVVGSFDNALPDPNGHAVLEFRAGDFKVTYAAASVTLSDFDPICLGDLDDDDEVELEDLLYVLANFGTAGPNPGDVDRDGDCDFDDLLLVLTNFGTTCP